MLGFKAFNSASATLQGIEVAHMVRIGRLVQRGNPFSRSSPTSQHKCVQRFVSFIQRENLRHVWTSPFGQEESLVGNSRSRVLTCMRPHSAAFTCRGPVWSSQIKSNSEPRAPGTVSQAGFPDLVSSTVAPYLPFDLPTPPGSDRLHGSNV